MLTPRTFPHLAQFDALSKTSLENHLRLYEGYVGKYNELVAQREAIQRRGPGNGDSAGLASLRGDLAFALSAIKNHELFFDSLGSDSQSHPVGPFAEALVKSFHSLPQYLVDLKQTALHSRGWAWTAYDLDHHFLFNYDGGGSAGGSAGGGLPVWNSVPILAIDLYGHSYFYDFGNNKTAYIETLLQNLHWPRIAQRYAAIATLVHV